MTGISNKMFSLLKEAPQRELEPEIREELIALGQDPKTVDFAIILQKCVRYGKSSDFMVMVLDSLLLKLCNEDKDLYDMTLKMSAAILEKEENANNL